MHSSACLKNNLRAARLITILLAILIAILAGADSQAQSKKRGQPKKGAQPARQSQPKKQAQPAKKKAAEKKPKSQPAKKREQPKKQARRSRETQPAKRARAQRAQPVVRAKPEYRAPQPIVYENPAWQPANIPQPWPRTDVAKNVIVLPQLVNPNNFSASRRPNFVIIHHTGQKTCDETLLAFSLPQAEVSSHYLVCRDGTVYQVLSDSLRAHHAGVGRWGSITDMNSCSIGIELDNNGSEQFYEPQIAGLLSLLGQLKKRYAIPASNFIGHGDYAPGRKSDPSVFFPWRLLAEQGFGQWYGYVQDTVPAGFDHLMAMRAVGYDTRDSVAAIRAFKRHFMQEESTQQINDADRRVLYQLSRP